MDGLYYYNARWYDPQLSRWVSPDTIVPQPGNVLAWDRFAYTLNNPVRYTDPSGHYEFEEGPTDEKFVPAHRGINPARQYVSVGVSNQEAANIFLSIIKSPLNGSKAKLRNFGDYRGLHDVKGPWEGKKRWHASIDAGNQFGLDVHPIAPGTVVFIGSTGLGNTVVIEHDVYGIKLYSVYGHLGRNSGDSGICTQNGSNVDYSTIIGFTGNSTPNTIIDPHLHFEVRFSANVDLSNTSSPLSGKRYWAFEGENWQDYFLDLGKRWGYDSDNFGGD